MKLPEYDVTLCVKREDLLHPQVSGNKFRKLKYNIAFAKANAFRTILTFGGAYSNHIAATAAAGKIENIETIGIIRGEELGKNLSRTLADNPTLRFASECGMQLHFVSRDDYRNKENQSYLDDVSERFNQPYIIPEGGTNTLAVQGCEEIISSQESSFDFICCPVGTGGTIAGLINGSQSHQKVLGFPALKGDFLATEIEKWVTTNTSWELMNGYHFGGYGKIDQKLISFINDFKGEYKIPLDPIYTGKMMYGIFDLIKSRYFPQKSRIFAVHTGGLQGISGMNKRLIKKNLPTIHT